SDSARPWPPCPAVDQTVAQHLFAKMHPNHRGSDAVLPRDLGAHQTYRSHRVGPPVARARRQIGWFRLQPQLDRRPSTALTTAHNTVPSDKPALSPHPAPSPYTGTASPKHPRSSPPLGTRWSRTGDTPRTRSPPHSHPPPSPRSRGDSPAGTARSPPGSSPDPHP